MAIRHVPGPSGQSATLHHAGSEAGLAHFACRGATLGVILSLILELLLLPAIHAWQPLLAKFLLESGELCVESKGVGIPLQGVARSIGF